MAAAPPGAQQFQHVGLQRHVAVLAALALNDADAHAIGVAVDVIHANRRVGEQGDVAVPVVIAAEVAQRSQPANTAAVEGQGLAQDLVQVAIGGEVQKQRSPILDRRCAGPLAEARDVLNVDVAGEDGRIATIGVGAGQNQFAAAVLGDAELEVVIADAARNGKDGIGVRAHGAVTAQGDVPCPGVIAGDVVQGSQVIKARSVERQVLCKCQSVTFELQRAGIDGYFRIGAQRP